MTLLDERAMLSPLFGEWHLGQLIDHSIALLKNNEPVGGYYGCFSGGKDSVVIKQLALEADVVVTWYYNKTTIDPPELVRFIREYHSDVRFVRPRHGNFFRRMAEVKGFPTRRNRWCCGEYKEAQSPKGATLILGIRAEESSMRMKRWGEVQDHWHTGSPTVQPILGWASDEVWEYIRGRNLSYSSLYDEGFHRLGCIGCPMAGEVGRRKEFARWPIYEQKWRRAFERIWERRAGTKQRDGRTWFGSARFDDWEAMWEWWLSDKSLPPEVR